MNNLKRILITTNLKDYNEKVVEDLGYKIIGCLADENRNRIALLLQHNDIYYINNASVILHRHGLTKINYC